MLRKTFIKEVGFELSSLKKLLTYVFSLFHLIIQVWLIRNQPRIVRPFVASYVSQITKVSRNIEDNPEVDLQDS